MPRNQSSSIKDESQYQELRKQGMSKEKAARIANSNRHSTGKRGGKHQRYEDWNKDELYRKARQVGIEGRASMSKQELIHALRDS